MEQEKIMAARDPVLRETMTPEELKEARREYSLMYHREKSVSYCFRLMKERDAVLIEHLDKIKNKTGLIRKLLLKEFDIEDTDHPRVRGPKPRPCPWLEEMQAPVEKRA